MQVRFLLAACVMAATALAQSVPSGNHPINLNAVGGTAADTNTGNASAGTLRVVLATNQPNFTTALNANVATNSSGLGSIVVCDNSQFLNMSTATTTEIVALSSGKSIYVCSWAVMSNGTSNVKLVRGTGTNCGTGTTDVSANYPLTAQTGVARGSGIGMLHKVTASNALCVTSSAAVTVAVDVTYALF